MKQQRTGEDSDKGGLNMKGNIIVGQSGGPTAVINSSLAGVVKTAKDRGAKKIYGMLHGIQGFLDGKYVDLSENASVPDQHQV